MDGVSLAKVYFGYFPNDLRRATKNHLDNILLLVSCYLYSFVLLKTFVTVRWKKNEIRDTRKHIEIHITAYTYCFLLIIIISITIFLGQKIIQYTDSDATTVLHVPLFIVKNDMELFLSYHFINF